MNALILAAGATTRMGFPKADLPWGQGTVLSEVVRMYALLQAETIVVVYGHDQPKALNVGVEQLSWVHHSNWYKGMRSSIRCGLSHAMTHECSSETFIHPVDCPGVHPNTIKSLQSARTDWSACPTYDGRRGHPLKVSSGLAKRLLSLDTTPLHEFVNDERTVFVPVNDSAILRNLNDKESYQNCLKSEFAAVQMTDHVD